MIIHKLSKKRQEKTVCGLDIVNFPNALTDKWGKVTCFNCRRLASSDEKLFNKYYQSCPHHVWGKELDNGQIKYISYCTYKELSKCSRTTCAILNKGEKDG